MNIEIGQAAAERAESEDVALWRRVGAQGSFTEGLRGRRKWTIRDLFVLFTLLFSFLAFILSIVALTRVNDDHHRGGNRGGDQLAVRNAGGSGGAVMNAGGSGEGHLVTQPSTNPGQLSIHTAKTISKIAFGSCTTYYPVAQTVWTQGVIPSDPDAWFWLGDLVYMDTAWVNCNAHPNASVCDCDVTLTTHPPHSCLLGNITSAREKVRMHLLENNYREFLKFMCPDSDSAVTFPQDGTTCPKPILGVYDDHDYGVNNANRHLWNKFDFKNLYLDILGEPQDSVRRSNVQGLEFKYTLNPDEHLERQIDVFALDERYNRDSLPCGIRRKWCKRVLRKKPDPITYEYLACDDFLNTGGILGTGSCCSADDKWALGWCKDNPHSDDELWDVACNTSSPQFGSMLLEVDNKTNTLIPKQQYDSDFSDMDAQSTFCEMLGPQQRKWFRNALEESQAPLKLILSGSVVFGSPDNKEERGFCSGDDWECYKVAQENFLHTVGSIENGCVIILAGDYHVSDLKMVEPASDAPYSKYYPTSSLKKPIYQIMSSGLTHITASTVAANDTCSGWRKDRVGLRPHGPCSLVIDPAFGMMEIDWEQRMVHFHHHSITNGSVTYGYDGSKQELTVDLRTCQMLR